MDFRGEPQSLTKRQLSWDKFRCSWGYPIQITWVFMGRTPSYRSVSRFPLGEDPRSTDPGIPGRDQIHLCLRSWSSQKQSSIGTLGEKKQVASMGEGQGYQSLSKCFTFGKEPTYHLFFVSPSFFLRPTVKFRVWFGMMWPISQCRNNTDWPPEEGLHHFATFCDPTIAVLCEHVKP